MSPLLITRVDPWRVDAKVNGQLAAYAIADQYGWALMRRVKGRIATVGRVDYGTTVRRDARVGDRLAALVLGVTR